MKKQSTAGSAIFVLTRLSNVSYLLTDLFFKEAEKFICFRLRQSVLTQLHYGKIEANANNCVKAFVAVLLKTLLATFI